MKKFFTLIIALTAFVMGSQTVRAEATETLEGTIKTGIVLNNPEDNNYIAYLLLWNYFHQLNMDFDEDTENVIISNLDGKVLFTLDENQTVTLAPGVTSADNIFYTITDEDRNSLRSDPDAYEFVAKYKSIKLRFGEESSVLMGTIKTGIVLNNPEDNNYIAYLLLWNYFHQLNMDFDEDTEDIIISNLDGKVLFTLDENQTVTLAPGVTSADNIFYTITDEDRNRLRKDPEAYEFVAQYETIELHFDTSGGGGNGEGGGNGDPERKGTLGTKGYWTFADGVLTVVYDGAMPTLTSKSDHADDPETAFRFKWTSFLSEIKEIVVTGKDVEIQPYFLYYEGEGTSDGQHPDDHIKTVTLGSGVKSLGRASLSLYELKRVNCYGINAPTLPVPHKAFWEKRITANLAFLWTVPNASTGYAKMNSEWAKFNHSATHLNPDDMPTPNNLADFETGKLNQAPFFSEGEYPWNVTNEDADGGTFSMKSGNKGVANTSSAISAMYLFETDGFIYFTAKCMGEGQGTGWDKCLFYIDGEQQFSYGALGDRWSSYSFPVSAGMHTFKWEYTKDSSVDPTGDGFFVDNIYFLQEGKDDDLITGIESLTPTLSEGERAWFDLSGRKLAGKPTQKGIYVNSGKKVMIK